jgi:signal transduction histidine kinase
MMSVGMESISSARLAEIGCAIQARADELVFSWEQESIREQPELRGEQRSVLRNQLPDFLRDYGRKLCDEEPPVPRRYAREHGLQRWQIGWDPEALVRDFMILRRVLFHNLKRWLGLCIDEALTIAATFDEAVAYSVSVYVQHREEELRKKKEELERSNYELRRFAHIVAHEIRNPLSLIMMGLQTLRDRNVPEDVLASVSEGAYRATDIVSDLLAYARVDTPEPSVEQVDLKLIVDEVRQGLHYLIAEREADVEGEDLPAIRGNASHVRQVLLNLVENAIKYAGAERPHVRITSKDRDDEWVISVKDNGLGIADEHKESIFRFLTRVHTEFNIPGTGIGLALCKRVVERHGGRIWVESHVGKGSTFSFTVPKHTEENR